MKHPQLVRERLKEKRELQPTRAHPDSGSFNDGYIAALVWVLTVKPGMHIPYPDYDDDEDNQSSDEKVINDE